MKIVSTFAFDVTIFGGVTLQKSANPYKVGDDVNTKFPPVNDVIYVVNAKILGDNPGRSDFIGFDPLRTVKDAEGKATRHAGLYNPN